MDWLLRLSRPVRSGIASRPRFFGSFVQAFAWPWGATLAQWTGV